MTYDIKVGSIYKVPYPFTDLSETKIRPALALTVADERGDAYFAFITTKPYANVDFFHLEARWSLDTVLDKVIEWNEKWQNNENMKDYCVAQISSYCDEDS